MGVTINSAVVPIVLAMFWERLTGLAMIAGSIGGTMLALITWISVAASYPGGLSNFKDNASKLFFFSLRKSVKTLKRLYSCVYFLHSHCSTILTVKEWVCISSVRRSQ